MDKDLNFNVDWSKVAQGLAGENAGLKLELLAFRQVAEEQNKEIERLKEDNKTLLKKVSELDGQTSTEKKEQK